MTPPLNKLLADCFKTFGGLPKDCGLLPARAISNSWNNIASFIPCVVHATQ